MMAGGCEQIAERVLIPSLLFLKSLLSKSLLSNYAGRS
ncbi:hypothetical protein SAMN05444158_7513 [Bradyrhizobium canariense]|uniref:Uncharacterized protein n=1 Tax=Bradyrhizobium canariense TaxID=255045 RepID=A0A1H2BT50_9BRAD|nr:hypothetical protein SAMN05444158_7513 [Bradyrhizobium canariense]